MSLHRLRDRLTRIEDGLDGGGGDGGDGNGPSVIRIKGGLPAEHGMHAAVGKLRFRRQPGEDQVEFEDRVIEAAIEADERIVVIGALPDWYGE